MKIITSFFVLLVFLSCNTGTSKTSGDSSSVSNNDNGKKEAVSFPYPINYSSQFEIGDPNKAKIILDLWKDYDNNNLDNSKGQFADTITMLIPGMEFHGIRDSMLSSMKTYRGSFSAVKSSVDAVISTKSTDNNADWVLVWGTETHTDKKNATDSVHLQETWRFNKDGKVDYMMQYVRQPPSARK